MKTFESRLKVNDGTLEFKEYLRRRTQNKETVSSFQRGEYC